MTDTQRNTSGYDPDDPHYLTLIDALIAGDHKTFMHGFRADDRYRVFWDYTWLRRAIVEEQVEIAKFLIEQGADFEFAEPINGGTPITQAASDGFLELIRMMRTQGAEFPTKSTAVNPLFRAIHNGHDAIAEYLINEGFDFNITYRRPDGERLNALSEAEQYGRSKIAELLRAKGATPPVQPEIDPASLSDVERVERQIKEYLGSRFGPVDPLGQQEILPPIEGMSVAIYSIRPNEEHPYLVLFTSGMSDQPMAAPERYEDWRYSELVMHLPPDWPHPRDSLLDPEWLWPLHALRQAAYAPHMDKSCLIPMGTIIPNGEPPEPLGPNTDQTCLLCIPDLSILSPPLRLDDGRIIHFHTVVPLYTSERDYERQHGEKKFFEQFVKEKVPVVVDVTRPSFA